MTKLAVLFDGLKLKTLGGCCHPQAVFLAFPEESQEFIRLCECATVVVCEDSAFRHCVYHLSKMMYFKSVPGI